MKILIPIVMVLEGGDLGSSLGVESEALLSRNSAPIKETPQSSLAPLPREDTVRNLPPGREPCSTILGYGSSMSGLQNVRNNFLLLLN